MKINGKENKKDLTKTDPASYIGAGRNIIATFSKWIAEAKSFHGLGFGIGETNKRLNGLGFILTLKKTHDRTYETMNYLNPTYDITTDSHTVAADTLGYSESDRKKVYDYLKYYNSLVGVN